MRDIRSAGGNARFYAADFASLAQVRGLTEEVIRDHSRLDILISRAGVGTGGRGVMRETSLDGFELRFAVNRPRDSSNGKLHARCDEPGERARRLQPVHDEPGADRRTCT